VVLEAGPCSITKCAGNWFRLNAVSPLVVSAGDSLVVEFAQVGLSLLAPPTTSTAAVLALRQYIDDTQLTITQGSRLTDATAKGLLEVMLDAKSGVAALSVPKAAEVPTLFPLRFKVLNPRWTVGLLQKHGYTIGHYHRDGVDRWTALGISLDGHSHAPLYTGMAAGPTDVSVGHPVIAAGTGAEQLFIQVTNVGNQTWHVALNNPTDAPISAVLSSGMGISQLRVPTGAVVVPAGGWVVLDQE
jgi:hypothetical protein